jgi:hypothetical protein
MKQRTVILLAAISVSLVAAVLTTTPVAYANHIVINPRHECKDVFEDMGFTHKEASDFCKDPEVLIKREHCRDFAESVGQDPEIAHEICQLIFTHKVNKGFQ